MDKLGRPVTSSREATPAALAGRARWRPPGSGPARQSRLAPVSGVGGVNEPQRPTRASRRKPGARREAWGLIRLGADVLETLSISSPPLGLSPNTPGGAPFSTPPRTALAHRCGGGRSWVAPRASCEAGGRGTRAGLSLDTCRYEQAGGPAHPAPLPWASRSGGRVLARAGLRSSRRRETRGRGAPSELFWAREGVSWVRQAHPAPCEPPSPPSPLLPEPLEGAAQRRPSGLLRVLDPPRSSALVPSGRAAELSALDLPSPSPSSPGLLPHVTLCLAEAGWFEMGSRRGWAVGTELLGWGAG